MSYLNSVMRHAANMIQIAATRDPSIAPVADIRERFSSRPDQCGNGLPVFRIYDHGVYVDTCFTRSGAEYRARMLNRGVLTIDSHATVGNRAVAA